MLISDKFHDECGVVAIFAHPEAEKLAYLGLHALQHRGQESAGIVTSDGLSFARAQGDGLGGRHLHRRCAVEDARHAGHRPHALLHCRRLGAAERAADPGAIEQGLDCGGAQRQPGQCAAGARATGESGIDFSDQQRHRSHRSPDRAFQGAHSAGSRWPMLCAASKALFRW